MCISAFPITEIYIILISCMLYLENAILNFIVLELKMVSPCVSQREQHVVEFFIPYPRNVDFNKISVRLLKIIAG